MTLKKLLTMGLAGTLLVGTIATSSAAELDYEWYAKQNPDVVAAVGDSPEALKLHYDMYGRKEARMANTKDVEAQLRRLFNVDEYAKLYPDVKEFYGEDAEAMFMHYISYGLLEARRPSEKVSQAAATSLKKAVEKALTDAGVAAAPGSVELVAVITGESAALAEAKPELVLDSAELEKVTKALEQVAAVVEKAVTETVKEVTNPAPAPASGGGSSASAPAPTATPSPSPSTAPTSSPSPSPGVSGGDVSTNVPTASPSPDVSTNVPTASPTAAPTASPTAAPTASPTAAPTASPTAAPTASPTAAPSASPTAAPTATPTASPTAAPTTAPTATPTAAPTASPTAAPTATPTTAPTASPTPAPGKTNWADVIKANLVDHGIAGDSNRDTSSTNTTLQGVKLSITAVNKEVGTTEKVNVTVVNVKNDNGNKIPSHGNANQAGGKWCGIGVPYKSDYTYLAQSADDANAAETGAAGENGNATLGTAGRIMTVDSKDYITAYWNLDSTGKRHGWIIVKNGSTVVARYAVSFAEDLTENTT